VLATPRQTTRIADARRPCVAGGRLASRAARVAEHAARQIRKADEILIDERVAAATEAAQPILYIRRVARLAHFSVVDDVDARLDLPCYHFGHRRPDAALERFGIHGNALLARIHRTHQVVGPRQAAGMSGQKALCASAHRRRAFAVQEALL
jgi:hypothetical protein